MAVPYFAAFAVTKAFLAEMAERGSGNVCSIYSPSAWFPFVGSVAYTAARWALRGFSAALRIEMRGTGVTVTDVVLAKIASNYWENNPGSEERLPWVTRLIPTLSVDQAAVTRAVERERREAMGPFFYSLSHQIGRLFPHFVHWCGCFGGSKRPSPR